jgi:hypothetical protein
MSSVSASVTSDIEVPPASAGTAPGDVLPGRRERQVLDWLTEQLVELGLEVEIDGQGI